MEAVVSNSTCVFCMKFSGAFSLEREWFDTELISSGDFLVAAGLGPFVEGYLMILTRQHYHSMAQLSTPQLLQLTVLKDEVRDVLTKCYRAPVVFEHGPAFPVSSGGSCIDHAHFQFLPLEIDLLPLLRTRHIMKPIRDLAALVELSAEGKPYLFFENQRGHMYVGEAENVPSQYLRRLIAKELGIPDQWDYALFPNYELIAATIERLTPWPSHDLEVSRTDP